jgi:hypothetical protein
MRELAIVCDLDSMDRSEGHMMKPKNALLTYVVVSVVVIVGTVGSWMGYMMGK